MNILSRNKVLATGIALILLTNVIVIGGAMYNRSGEPEAVLTLSERELSLRNWNQKENSGLSLGLDWRGQYYDNLELLGPGKLRELGYKLIDSDDRQENSQYARKQLPRAAWIVLEFDGASYQAAVQEAEGRYQEEKRLLPGNEDSETQEKRLKSAEENLEWLKESSSRLYAIDAGLDPAQLRQRYPDRSHYIVTAGIVNITYDYDSNNRERIKGYISDINVDSIHIPLEHRVVFDSLPERQYRKRDPYYYSQPVFKPRYQVKLAYGRRYEPWIVNVEKSGNRE